jgi:hypothetical protein
MFSEVLRQHYLTFISFDEFLMNKPWVINDPGTATIHVLLLNLGEIF